MTMRDRVNAVNAFITEGAQKRARERMVAYLGRNSMNLGGVNDFDAAMEAICKAMIQMYSDAMCDTLDVVNNAPLGEVK